ncbi:PAS domain-containing protein [Arcanobacterium canis]
MTVEPTGAHHDVAPHELFFSTTDSKGVIKLSNGVFTRLSRYPHDKLTGAPHNIIRHPAMPGAAFKAMWDTLEAGEPFAAYVMNLAADGSQYDVFATITPLKNGDYLSVRSRPCREDLFNAVRGIYAHVRVHEHDLLDSGMNRRESAATALTTLSNSLTAAGFRTYEDFQNLALPAEVAAREASTDVFPTRWGDTALHYMLGSVWNEFDTLNTWMNRQDQLADMSQRLADGAHTVFVDMREVGEVAGKFTALGTTYPALSSVMEPLMVWNQMQLIVGNYLSTLLGRIEDLRTNIARTRFRIALARLHSNTCGFFIAELIDAGFTPTSVPDADGSAPSGNEQLESLEMLSDVLIDDVETLEKFSRLHQKLISDTTNYIDQVLSGVSIPRQLLQLWQKSVTDVDIPIEGKELAAVVSRAIDHAGESLQRLENFKNELASAGETHENFATLKETVAQVQTKIHAMRSDD